MPTILFGPDWHIVHDKLKVAIIIAVFNQYLKDLLTENIRIFIY